MSGKIKLLVTGATGFIGSSVVNEIMKEKNIEVCVLVRSLEKAKKIFDNNVKYILIDNTFKQNIENFSPKIVLHLAAFSSSADDKENMLKLIESNITNTALLLDALRDIKLEMFINTSSFSQYYYNDERIFPTYFYSSTKIAANDMVKYFSLKNNFKLVNTVLYTVYGKKEGRKKLVDYAIDSLDSKQCVNMSEGKQQLDFIHIDDVVTFYKNLIFNYKKLNIKHENYFLGTGVGTTPRELAELLKNITNRNTNINFGAKESRKIDTIQATAKIVNNILDLDYKVSIKFEDGLKMYIKSNYRELL